MDAGEPEERAAEENDVVEKDWERNAERIGSEAMASSADVAAAVVVGLLKVERRWRGEADLWSGDAGEAIFCVLLFWKCVAFLLFSLLCFASKLIETSQVKSRSN